MIIHITMAKRGRKPSKDRKGYFYEKEEEALIEYLNTTDERRKNELFCTVLQPALTKMIESIIRRYKLYTPDELYEDTFNDTMSFLLSKIEHFNPNSGYKAYSYCGTICKNYLILKINKYDKNLKRNDRYEEIREDIDDNVKYSYDDSQDSNQMLGELIDDTVNIISEIIDKHELYGLTDNEKLVGQALITLMQSWEELFARMGSNKFNKSSILLFLRELTNLTTQEIRHGMKRYKTLYKELRKKMIEDTYR